MAFGCQEIKVLLTYLLTYLLITEFRDQVVTMIEILGPPIDWNSLLRFHKVSVPDMTYNVFGGTLNLTQLNSWAPTLHFKHRRWA